MIRRLLVLAGVSTAILGGLAVALTRDGRTAPPRPAILLGSPEVKTRSVILAPVGEAVTFGADSLRNRSGRPVKLVSYRTRSVAPGLVPLGTRILGERRPFSIAGDIGFPPDDLELQPHYRAVRNYRLAPFRPANGDRGTDVLIGFRSTRRGLFTMSGTELTYVQDGRRRVARSTHVIGICAVSKEEFADERFEPFKSGGLCDRDRD